MAIYRLSREAVDDVDRIIEYGFETFGLHAAEAYHQDLIQVFERLAARPQLYRLRPELGDGIRVARHKAHIVIFRRSNDGGVLIVRVRNGREDWMRASTNQDQTSR